MYDVEQHRDITDPVEILTAELKQREDGLETARANLANHQRGITVAYDGIARCEAIIATLKASILLLQRATAATSAGNR